MQEAQKVNPLVVLLQKIFSQLWNAGLFENVDALRNQGLSKIAQKRSSKVQQELQGLRSKLLANGAHRHLQFKASDEVLLDGMLLNAGREKVILFVPGIGSFYEKIGEDESVISRFYAFFTTYFPDHSVFVFNSRGIGQSGGTFDLNKLYLDTVSAYRYLMKDMRYDLDSILLYTHSLGGLHATQGAGIIQKQFPDVKMSVINDRSLGEVATFTKAFLKESTFGDLAANLVDKLGLNLSAKTAWESLTGQKVVIVSKHDKTIPYEKAAFCHLVKCGKVIHLEGPKEQLDHHTRAFTSEEAVLIVRALQQK
ncbi:alpha/beta hydrolase family protein [Simkania sp.]|uniref:alpha/beta hydrolase family protein n=1 Tax=Simkania sp. TaxID=34094 RepID=UPI003B515AFF